MTDRIQHLTVILSDDFRDDDVEHIVNAIKMIKCVRKVELGAPVDCCDHMARQRVYWEMREKLLEIFTPSGIKDEDE